MMEGVEAPEREEPLLSGIGKEQLIIVGGKALKEEPCHPEYCPTIEESNEKGAVEVMEGLTDPGEPECEDPSLSGEIKKELIVEDEAMKEERCQVEFWPKVEEPKEEDKLESQHFWNESKDPLKLPEDPELSSGSSLEDSSPGQKEFFKSLEESIFPVVQLHPLDTTEQNQDSTQTGLRNMVIFPEMTDSQTPTINGSSNPMEIVSQTGNVSMDNDVKVEHSFQVEPTFKCSLSSGVFKNEKFFKRHVATHSKFNLLEFSCRQFMNNYKSYFKAVKRKYRRTIKRFKCSQCPYASNRNDRLKRHMLTHSNFNQSKFSLTKQFRCSDCGYETKRKDRLKRHMLTHTNLKPFKCSECTNEFKYKYNLQQHKLIHSRDNDKQFKCSECDYTSNQERYLKRHALKHITNKIFKCSMCSYECNYSNHFSQHMLTHTNIKKFKCSDCDFECKHKQNLKLHRLSHLDVKQYKCPECDFECNYKYNMRAHRLTHSNIKPFKCSECDYECYKERNLKDHKLTHSDTKQFKCPECNYETHIRNYLVQHMVVHSTLKQFKCSECNYETKRKSHLKYHMLTHSSIQRYMCPDCGFKCNKKKHFLQHKLNH